MPDNASCMTETERSEVLDNREGQFVVTDYSHPLLGAEVAHIVLVAKIEGFRPGEELGYG